MGEEKFISGGNGREKSLFWEEMGEEKFILGALELLPISSHKLLYFEFSINFFR